MKCYMKENITIIENRTPYMQLKLLRIEIIVEPFFSPLSSAT